MVSWPAGSDCSACCVSQCIHHHSIVITSSTTPARTTAEEKKNAAKWQNDPIRSWMCIHVKRRNLDLFRSVSGKWNFLIFYVNLLISSDAYFWFVIHVDFWLCSTEYLRRKKRKPSEILWKEQYIYVGLQTFQICSDIQTTSTSFLTQFITKNTCWTDVLNHQHIINHVQRFGTSYSPSESVMQRSIFSSTDCRRTATWHLAFWRASQRHVSKHVIIFL